MGRSCEFDVLIVGSGPAGMAAACCAARAGRHVAVVDDNPTPGGQIWRGGAAKSDTGQAAAWFRRVQAAKVEFLAQTQVVAQLGPGRLLGETTGGACELGYRKLILATGARERFLPFPGWTLPNVVGAGGLQSLVKSGLPVRDKKVAVAGSGPLLLAAAAYLRRHGADVRLIAEQAPWARLVRFGLRLLGSPGKLIQGAGYKLELLGVPYKAGCWPVAAEGDRCLESVTFRHGRKTRAMACDYLACGFGFVPNLELPLLLGCRIEDGAVWVDDWQETSTGGVYCAGESTGVGGVELALIEGRIAGYSAVDNRKEAARLFGSREKAWRFAHALDRAFSLRDELEHLATAETIICRCEDVSRARLEPYDCWRSAKLQTRCGMGPCQGRICGPAVEHLFGWTRESVRPPVFPVSLEALAGTPGEGGSGKGER